MFSKIKALAILTVASLAFSASANATVVDFNGLVNFSNYTENGMSMTSSTVWNWPGANEAHMDSGVATFKLVSGANFSLDSVDMVNIGNSGAARFSAFNNGSLLGNFDIAANTWGTVNFSSLFEGIDEFRVSVIGNHFTYDNLNFTVPEPGSLSLLGLSLVGMVGAIRRRRATSK